MNLSFGLDMSGGGQSGSGSSSGALRYIAANANGSCVVTHAPVFTFGRILTLQFKFNPSSFLADSAIISKGIGTGNPFDIRWNSNNGSLSVHCYDGTIQPGSIIVLPDLNKWYDIVYRRDGTNCQIFRDGTLINTVTDTTVGSTDNATNISFGKRTGATQYFDGAIGPVRLWTSALSDAQISDMFNYLMIPRTTLIGEWLFREGTGSTALDTSGQGNNGVITNAYYTSGAPFSPPFFLSLFDDTHTFVAPQTTKGTWIDGTATGSATDTSSGWAFNSSNSIGAGTVMFDSSVKHSGTKSLKVSTTGTGQTTVASNIKASTIPQMAYAIPVAPNTTYNYSFWMQTNFVAGDSNDGVCIMFKERLANSTTVATTFSTKVKTTTGMTNYTGSITTGETSVYMDIEPAVIGNTGAASLVMDGWFDDLVLTRP